MRTKLQTFRLNSLSSGYDIISITETWLNSSVYDGEVCDDGAYSLYRRDRDTTVSTKNEGGGVLLAIKNNLNSERITALESDLEDL